MSDSGFVKAPGSVHKKHECPPSNAVMFAQLQEIQTSYDTRLANQKQVIENLDGNLVLVRGDRDRLFTVLSEMKRILNHDYDASDQLELWHQLKDMVNKAVG